MEKTPLYEEHVALNATIVDYSGWLLPVQYPGGIIAEHKAVRNCAGMFDVSHMGEIMLEGSGAEDYLQHLLTNDIRHLLDRQIEYSLLCYEDGGIVDDLLVYRYDKEKYLLVVNAANIEKDWAYLNSQPLASTVKLTNISAQIAQIAIQGPAAEAILAPLCSEDLTALAFYYFYPVAYFNGVEVMISRTGYTGEDGFEIYFEKDKAPALWQYFLAEGAKDGLTPVGLGARDTLRFEAALPLYGHELNQDIKPLEARTSYFVRLEKPEDFPGKQVLIDLKAKGISRKLAGLEMLGPGVPRSGYEVFYGETLVGTITSGGFSPSTGKNLALALLSINAATIDKELTVMIRRKPVAAKVVALPFVKKKFKPKA